MLKISGLIASLAIFSLYGCKTRSDDNAAAKEVTKTKNETSGYPTVQITADPKQRAQDDILVEGVNKVPGSSHQVVSLKLRFRDAKSRPDAYGLYELKNGQWVRNKFRTLGNFFAQIGNSIDRDSESVESRRDREEFVYEIDVVNIGGVTGLERGTRMDSILLCYSKLDYSKYASTYIQYNDVSREESRDPKNRRVLHRSTPYLLVHAVQNGVVGPVDAKSFDFSQCKTEDSMHDSLEQ